MAPDKKQAPQSITRVINLGSISRTDGIQISTKDNRNQRLKRNETVNVGVIRRKARLGRIQKR